MKLYGKLGILPAIGLIGWFVSTMFLDHAQNKRLEALEKLTPKIAQQESYPPKWVDHKWACGRCGAPYDGTQEHQTQYKNNWFIFVLCEHCWRELKTPEARMPYYRGSFDYNESMFKQEDGKWEAISNAVMAETSIERNQ